MSVLFLDGINGISGDMTLGSLISHVNQDEFLSIMSSLAQIKIVIEPVEFNEIIGNSVQIHAKNDVQRRNLHDIINIINDSKLPSLAKENAVAIFNRLAVVEAKIHKVDIEKLHFHEVGAIDSIGDIAGAALLFEMIGAQKIIASPINLGSGKVNCAHGEMDVPVPAVRAMLDDVPTISVGNFERTTPTGLAILNHYVSSFSKRPESDISSIGNGFGDNSKDSFLKSILYI